MLKWWDKCWVGEKVKGSVSLRSKINSGKAVPGIYLVTLSDHTDDILEIVPAVVLVQKAAYEICPLIIGIAKGKEEAIALVQSIVEEVYQETGDFQVEEYIKNR